MVDISQRLKFSRYRLDRQAHIEVDYVKCRRCTHRACLTACPAQCYLAHAENGVLFNYEGCLECGTCYVICDLGALKWNYPKGGCGVNYRFA
ncbi:MAG: ferredoxin [Firmicutes bacterium]|nr:ferredoxin [Bacillota bacterium]